MVELYEDMNEYKLAEEEEVVEGCTHAHQEGSHADKQPQDGASPEEVVEIAATGPVTHIVNIHLDVSRHLRGH